MRHELIEAPSKEAETQGGSQRDLKRTRGVLQGGYLLKELGQSPKRMKIHLNHNRRTLTLKVENHQREGAQVKE